MDQRLRVIVSCKSLYMVKKKKRIVKNFTDKAAGKISEDI